MKIVAFDTESTDLKAMMGRLLCASFQEIGSGKECYTFRVKKFDDAKLALACRDALEQYNLVVTWNGKLHDIPLLNARLAKAHERPVHLQWHLDLMWYAGGSSMKIGSRKLVNVQKYLGLGEEKTEISWDVWQRAATGDNEAMEEVVGH